MPAQYGAWCAAQATCYVSRQAYPTTGSDVYYYDETPGTPLHVLTFNAKHPTRPFPVHPSCNPAPTAPWKPPVTTPPATPPGPPQAPPPPKPNPSVPPIETPPPKPITGDHEPPVSCKPTGPITGDRSAASFSERDDFRKLGFRTRDHFAMPQIAALNALELQDSASKPLYDEHPEIRRKGRGEITMYHAGHGPGYVVMHPSKLNPVYDLWGHQGVARAKWSNLLSSSMLLLLSAINAAGTAAWTTQRLGWGLAAKGRTDAKPSLGWYFEHDPVVNTLKLTPTIVGGNDSTSKVEKHQVNGVFNTTSGRIILPTYITADTTLTAGQDLVFIQGAFITTLEPSPENGTRKILVNETGAARTVNRNGKKIDGAAANLSLPAGAAVILFYDAAPGVEDWRIVGSDNYRSGASIVFPLQAPDDGVANYAFDGGTTPGSENAGLAFAPGDTGPSLLDVAAAVQLQVSTAGVTIPNKLTVGGLIDPTGLELTPVAANPGGVPARTIYIDDGTNYVAGSMVMGTTATPVVAEGGIVVAGSGGAAAGMDFDPVDAEGPRLLDAGGTEQLRVNLGQIYVPNRLVSGEQFVAAGLSHFAGKFTGAAGDDVAIGAVSKVHINDVTNPLTGMVPADGGAVIDGQLVFIENGDGTALTVSHGSTSAPANQFMCPGNVDLSVPRGGGVIVEYSTTDGRWRVVSIASGGSSGSASATEVEVDLGSTPKAEGTFTITDAAIDPTKKVLCWQAPGPYTGKGASTEGDEAALQPVMVVAVKPGSGSAVVYWQTPPEYALVRNGIGGGSPNLNAIGATYDRNSNQRFPEDMKLVRTGLVAGNVKFLYSVFA